MDKQEVIWLINTELDKTQDQHIRDMLTDIKASCYSPLTNIDLGPNLVASSATLLAIEKLVHISQNECQIVVNHLIERYMKHFKKRYFPDSKVHYEKLRIVQMILLLLSHPHNRTNTELCERLKSFSYYCLYEETNQNCVRQLLSWILVVAASKSLSEVLDRMQCSAVPVSTLINIIPALYHLVQQSDESILERVISMTLPWTMGSQFRLRVYAQELIRKILEDAKEKHSDFCKKYEYLKTCIDNTINSTQDAYKNSLKTDLVFFTKFNPLENISKQIILVEIPMLNKVHPSEWDCVKLIIDRVKLPKQNEPLTQLFSTDVAKFLKTSDPLLKNYSEALAESNNELIHIQKKITPWKSNLDNLNSQANSDFVLIASLISKPQNLGGLSRTCEVFGIRDITFNDAKVINDKEFKSLSMSSEGWINAIEVKEVDLREYVGSLRSEGFYVIGAEQTAGSEPLNKFQFPRKLALILGNEKTGIPADVIPLLDKCLEIPQFGQTRSLNVHVAGATFIWEYAKQHLVG
ncbi:probable methyltransferase TARBP1 isoform X2 [Anthonomus grandis grandis]|uniref:probable methyltransferase TARBP1 isoform X2 n=1 Tax=Anthonomus grandis grandis TaxID=2921223 RepID=UPI002165255B|nr:probable methyltransferase TARBP1 isoform X2 [Anthonomus grandis grandis]